MSQERHKVGIAIPSGQNMEVQVIVDAGARDTAQIHTDIKTMRPHHLIEHLS